MAIRNALKAIQTTKGRGRVEIPGQEGDQDESRGIESDRDRQNDGEGVEMDGTHCGTGGARHDSKWVGTRLLAEEQACEHGWYEFKSNSAPSPSIPLPTDWYDQAQAMTITISKSIGLRQTGAVVTHWALQLAHLRVDRPPLVGVA
jgi:hypothetical protein